jgi:hypothetical protein
MTLKPREEHMFNLTPPDFTLLQAVAGAGRLPANPRLAQHWQTAPAYLLPVDEYERLSAEMAALQTDFLVSTEDQSLFIVCLTAKGPGVCALNEAKSVEIRALVAA